MSFRAVLDALALLDSPKADGQAVVEAVTASGGGEASSTTIHGEKGQTDFVKIVIPGRQGKRSGGNAPTLGIIGRLGGVGARPEAIGMVSDADGAVTAVAAALKISRMAALGDTLLGDVIISTHVCPNSPTLPHDPVPFMAAPVDMATMNRYEVDPDMDAVLSIDTTKGNRIINVRGFAISPTVKEGYILRVSEDLLDIMCVTTGKAPVTFPITTQDITPYGNGLFHLNSILQPSTATDAPVVGVAITACSVVPGCATGASHPADIEEATRFVIEAAKAFGAGKCSFYDENEFAALVRLYGPMTHLRTMGREA
ncbi:MAG: DUF1177 domain-containing protein [Bacillota bacterium]|jgi:hypothetical protein|nr:DUF1177 domain-containing protein [Candidatus Fermentithermobacillaceae bacterium]